MIITKPMAGLKKGDVLHRIFPTDEHCKIESIVDHYDKDSHTGLDFWFNGFIVPQKAMRKMFETAGGRIKVD